MPIAPYEIAITHDDESGYGARDAGFTEKMMALYVTTLMLDGDPIPEPHRVHA